MKRILSATAPALVSAVALGASVLAASPARADEPPPGPCVFGSTYTTVESAEVKPVLTHFRSLNIANGTSGVQTYTLTQVDSVTTTINSSVEINSEAGKLFAKVALKVGFSVQTSTSSTTTESTSFTWNFTAPGYYGIYKGTRRVSGAYKSWVCRRVFTDEGTTSAYLSNGSGTYTTFANLEDGTISCADQVPNGSLRDVARRQLAC